MPQKKTTRKKAGRNKQRRGWNRKQRILIVSAACAVAVLIGAGLTAGIYWEQRSSQQDGDQLESENHEMEPHVEDYERAEADYEQWLAASVITCISMNNPDFELEEVYASTQTTIDDRMNSQGIYVTYQSGGETLCILAKPLEQGRSGQAGTKDVYSELTGYASYEEVSADTIDVSQWHTVDMQELNTLIEQSERVVLYEN